MHHMNVPIVIDRARWWALSTPAAVFYGSLATHLVDVMDSSIDTAATDGKRILWNPEFVAKLTDEEVRFVLLHETLHCAHDHFSRLPLDSKGNEAGDYAINLILQNIPGIKMPEGGLLDKAYADLAEEEILSRLARQPQPKPGNGQPKPGNGQPKPGNDPGGCGGFIQPAPDKPGQTTLKEKWEQAVIQGAFVAKSLGQGNVPADMQRVLDKVQAMDVNWRDEMADFVKTAIGCRNDWSRSSRRMATAPVIYPRRQRDQIGTVIVARDTSGSIDNALCAEFSAQISSISADVGCEVIVIDCDTEIHREVRLGAGEACPLDAQGGGGTAFAPVFDRAAQLIGDGEQIAGLIYLTDLDGSFPTEPADYPVLWAAYNTKSTAPFGRTTHLR